MDGLAPDDRPDVRAAEAGVVLEERGVAGRTRRAPTRLDSERLAAAGASVREGLAWLGRPPEPRATLRYRAVRSLGRAILCGLSRFRIEATGCEHLPHGPCLLVGAAHRGWMDHFLVLHAVPPEPRARFLCGGPPAFVRPSARPAGSRPSRAAGS